MGYACFVVFLFVFLSAGSIIMVWKTRIIDAQILLLLQ